MAFFTWSLVFILLGCLGIAKLTIYYMKRRLRPNPFASDETIPIRPKVTNQRERDNVLKQGFHINKVPANLDAIVIGSGIGGLSVAAILSKVGKKVLVLEQHDQSGGCCHTFIDKGYEFDVGIHYIGDVNDGTLNKTFLDQISQGQITWEPLDDNFDTIVFKSSSKEDVRYYEVCKGADKWKESLKRQFPSDVDGIERFFEMMKKVEKEGKTSMIIKFIPIWLVKILNRLNMLHFISDIWSINKKTIREFVEEVVENEDLRDIFCYTFGDYGTSPREAGIPIQMMLHSHFLKSGAYYPVGGASEFAFHIIPVIESSGGKVLVRSKVDEILIDDSGKVSGVKVKHGSSEHSISAPIIISDAGAHNTFHKLLPSQLAASSQLWPIVTKAKRSFTCLSIFVGLDCSADELNIPLKKNYWAFTSNDISKNIAKYIKLQQSDVEDVEFPVLFISFPSTKDPTWSEKYEGKTTMIIITFVDHSWFTEWENEPATRRGDEYERFKKILGHKLIDRATDLFPKIKNHVDFVAVGTPLSNEYYLGSEQGEIYGLDHNQERFSAMNTAMLRPDVDIPGLYLTGQDVCSAGFIGGLYGGLLCAQAVLERNLFSDLVELHKKMKKIKQAISNGSKKQD